MLDFKGYLKLLQIIDSTYTTLSDCQSIKFEINNLVFSSKKNVCKFIETLLTYGFKKIPK